MAAKTFNVSQNNSYILSFNLVDENDVAILEANIGTLVLSYYYENIEVTTADKYHLATINGRSSQDVKDANNVVLSSTGTVTWTILPTDTIKLNSITNEERHIAVFTWFYATGKQNSVEIIFNVRKVQYAE